MKTILNFKPSIKEVIMPVVDGKKYPYTKKGKAAAKAAKKKKKKPGYNISKNIGYYRQGGVPPPPPAPQVGAY